MYDRQVSSVIGSILKNIFSLHIFTLAIVLVLVLHLEIKSIVPLHDSSPAHADTKPSAQSEDGKIRAT